MGLKDQVNQNTDASHQATTTPSGCKACKRKGIPIFPLRVAAVPKSLMNRDWLPAAVPKQDAELTGGGFKYALRTLRMGYLYVLLDQKIWQVYQVTANGCMRQLNSLAMPESDTIEPLAESCRTANHDIPTSFINIDKDCKEAWLAFSRDPWSPEVMAGYLEKKRPSTRFTKIILTGTQVSAGDKVCMPLDPSLATLKANVAEFSADVFANVIQVTEDKTGGAHGFYPRRETVKHNAMESWISHLEKEYSCTVMAVVVNDPVGIVQELNIARMQLTEACQAYIQKPGVLHKHVISIAITQYLDNIKAGITQTSSPRYKMTGPAIGGFEPEYIPKEKVAEEAFAVKYARLLKSYDETARAASEKEFTQYFTVPEQQLKAIDKDLAAWYQVRLWEDIINHDYASETNAAGWAAQMKTIAACVQGGAMGEETKKVWQQWLQKANSPAYLGFTGMKTSLLETVFSGGNVYSDIKTGLTSDEFGNYLKSSAIQQGWASRILAVTGSVSLLGKTVDPAMHKGYQAMLQSAMLTAGESTVVLEYETTFRKLKRNLKNNAALRQSLSVNNESFKDSGRKGGSAAVVDEIMGMRGKELDTPVKVQYSTLGTLEQLKSELPHLNVTEKPFNNPAMMKDFNELFISDVSLQGKGQKTPIVKASYAQMAKWNERGRRYISGDSAGLILGAGLLGLQLADWKSKADALKNSVGTDVDALADYAINRLLVLEGMAEVAGFASKLAVKLNWVVLSEAQQVPKLVRFGGVLAGIAAVADGIRYAVLAAEARKKGDSDAADYYRDAAIVTILGGGTAIASALAGSFALLGPAGLAAILIITGIILAYEAAGLRSTAFEIWLRRTCFGIPGNYINNYPIWHAGSLEDLAEAVVEYRAIVSGMVADVAFASDLDILTGTATVQSVKYRRLDFRVSMPGWVEGKSAWSATLTRDNDSVVLFSQSHNIPGFEDHYQLAGPDGYGKYQWHLDEENDENGKPTGVASLNVMVSVWVEQNRTPAVTLVTEYWPDKTEQDYKLGMTLNAQQG
ncbi:hypothetical protein C5Y41_24540 [Rahnella variigena]|uniref:T6SS effector BTH_I2691 family protein n=1 Tax=Rahnella variigena TaxID=574964 RepID=UPI00101D2EEB|nr:T6SS effector BTH_I2691 family protein [Rahnella variigena]RYJ12636.1 hypothetical protein C5Y41_24540 [Rahnella variigena]